MSQTRRLSLILSISLGAVSLLALGLFVILNPGGVNSAQPVSPKQSTNGNEEGASISKAPAARRGNLKLETDSHSNSFLNPPEGASHRPRPDGLSETDRANWHRITTEHLATLRKLSGHEQAMGASFLLKVSIGTILRNAGQVHEFGYYKTALDPIRDKGAAVFTLNSEEFIVLRGSFPDFDAYRDWTVLVGEWELSPLISSTPAPALDPLVINSILLRAEEAVAILEPTVN